MAATLVDAPFDHPDWVFEPKLDGEVVYFDAEGRTSFRALQQRFHLLDPAEIRARAERFPASIFLFDLLGLDGRDLTGEPLLERKTGLHVLVPWRDEGDYDRARGWALAVATRVAEALLRQATVEVHKAKRGRRVYVDVLQNARGHHAVPPYVLRAVPGAPVSTPLEWRELTPALDPKAFNLKTIFRRLARKKRDPMAPLLRAAAGVR